MRVFPPLLRKHGACAEQIALFKRTFPKGASLTNKNAIRALNAGLTISWLECLLPAPAALTYKKTMVSAYNAYRKTILSADRTYRQAMASADHAYDKVWPANKAIERTYTKAIADAMRAYKTAEASAWRTYKKTQALILLRELKKVL